MIILKSFIMACSLCADCLAVSLCSSVTLKRIEWGTVARVAVAFAVIQSGLLLCGWAFGNLFIGLVEKVAHLVGFLLLLYVGGSMLIEGIKALKGREAETRDLNGWKNIVLGGIATSIDAMAVGVAQSMAGQAWREFLPLFLSVLVVTAASVVIGICGGRTIGGRLGHKAEIVGGAVLIGIGVSVLL